MYIYVLFLCACEMKYRYSGAEPRLDKRVDKDCGRWCIDY